MFGVGSVVLHHVTKPPTVARPISSPLRPEALLIKSIEKEASAAASLPTEMDHVGVA